MVLFRALDRWIRVRLRSKMIGRTAYGSGQRKTPNCTLAHLGLVSLVDLLRAVLARS